MINLHSYLMGFEKGQGTVELTGNIICTDDGTGHVTITLADDTEEVADDVDSSDDGT